MKNILKYKLKIKPKDVKCDWNTEPVNWYLPEKYLASLYKRMPKRYLIDLILALCRDIARIQNDHKEARR